MKRAANLEPPDFRPFKACGRGFFRQGTAEPDPDAMNSLIASELNQLSSQEREAAFEDLHAVANVREEVPEAISTLVTQVKHEIAKIREKSAYSKALFLSPNSVNNLGFIRMFLRAEQYNPRLAANRMVSYFQHKLELFGIEKLSKNITLEDLDEDDKAALFSGSIQFLPQKDSAGRTVIFSAQRLKRFKTMRNQLKAAWYIFMSLTEDEDVQRNGVVLVFYNIGASLLGKVHIDYFMRSKSMSTSLPIKAAGFHFCYDNALLQPLVTTIQMVLGRNWRARSRVHYGSHLECSYALTSYGIPKELLPVDVDGNIRNNWLPPYLEKMKVKEAEAAANVDIRTLCPRRFDVLLGRGRPYQEFPGNVRLAEIIDERRESYQQSIRKLRKTAISNEVLKMIKDDSIGRFLKKHETEEGIWVEVSDEMARDKISHCFRTKARKRWPVPTWPGPTTSVFPEPDSFGYRKMSIDSDTDMSIGHSQSKRPRPSPKMMEEVVASGSL